MTCLLSGFTHLVACHNCCKISVPPYPVSAHSSKDKYSFTFIPIRFLPPPFSQFGCANVVASLFPTVGDCLCYSECYLGTRDQHISAHCSNIKDEITSYHLLNLLSQSYPTCCHYSGQAIKLCHCSLTLCLPFIFEGVYRTEV